MMRAGGGGQSPGAVAITGGTIAGVTGVPLVITAGGIPFIGLSSGSVAANGAISGITALPRIYPSAYCYFPANALATAIAAGFYYCTFSSTTAGVAFLDTYVSGKATIPASPTAVTDGKGAFTGHTSEEFAHTLTIPAMTATSAIRMAFAFENPNNANAKTFNVRLSGSGGTIFLAYACASTGSPAFVGSISNTGATNKQISAVHSIFVGTVNTQDVLGTIDTSAATSLVLSLTRATATDNFILLPPIIDLVA